MKNKKTQKRLPNLHEIFRVVTSCSHFFFNGSKTLKANDYQTYSNFTGKIYFKLGEVVGNTYDP